MNLMLLTIKNVQAIWSILSEHRVQIVIILSLICVLNVFLNVVILNDCENNIRNKKNKIK